MQENFDGYFFDLCMLRLRSNRLSLVMTDAGTRPVQVATSLLVTGDPQTLLGSPTHSPFFPHEVLLSPSLPDHPRSRHPRRRRGSLRRD